MSKPGTITATAVSSPANDAHTFGIGDTIVHPSRGVFTISEVRSMTVDADEISVLILTADGDAGYLAVPVAKASTTLRPLMAPEVFEEAFGILRQKLARGRRMVWARRALDFAARIKGGDPIRIAEMMRNIHVGNQGGEISYSERRIFEQALERFVAEYSAVTKMTKDAAREQVLAVLDEPAAPALKAAA